MKRSRNLDLGKVEIEVQSEVDGDKIKSRTEQVVGKLRGVQEQLASLFEQLEAARDASRKSEGQILESVKDRIEVNERVTADSKYPRNYEERKQGVKELADRYNFLEEENSKFEDNYDLLDGTLAEYQARIAQLDAIAQKESEACQIEMIALKKEFAHYKRLEEQETVKNNQLDKQLKDLKQLYEHIDEHIASCRDRYGAEQAKANALQQELAQRVKQFQDRQAHDRQVLLNKKKLAGSLQQQLMTVKLISNEVNEKNAQLQIKEVEVSSPKS